MAIYAKSKAYSQSTPLAATFVPASNDGALTEQATQMHSTVPPKPQVGHRGTTVSLAIDLDDPTKVNDGAPADVGQSAGESLRREPIRRDSLKRREALLKGKEGSRRRTRWMNGSYHVLNT